MEQKVCTPHFDTFGFLYVRCSANCRLLSQNVESHSLFIMGKSLINK